MLAQALNMTSALNTSGEYPIRVVFDFNNAESSRAKSGAIEGARQRVCCSASISHPPHR